LAKVLVIGDKPVESPERAAVQTRASLGPEMTAVKAVQKQLCDGFLHLFNPGEVHEIKCECPDMAHIRQFMDNAFFEVTLSMAEKMKLSRLVQKAAE